MLAFIPVIIMATLGIIFLFDLKNDQQTYDISRTLANDFMRVHNNRVDFVRENGISDGEVDYIAASPFEPFFDYYTEVHQTGLFEIVVTWPVNPGRGVSFTEDVAHSVTTLLERRENHNLYSGNFIPFPAPRTGGMIGVVDVSGLDAFPAPDMPVLMQINAR